MTEANILTLTEAASYLRVHPTTIYRLIRGKHLPYFRVGSDYRFRREALDDWIKDQETNGKILKP